MSRGWGTQERLWLGLVAVPLAELAAGLRGALWTWPVLLVCAWAWTPSWRWLWVLALELGCVGLMWADVGIDALTRVTADQRWLVGIAWAAFPLALAGVGLMNRRDHGAAVRGGGVRSFRALARPREQVPAWRQSRRGH
jgi:hypothetical protein